MADLVTVLLPQINAEVEYHLGSNHPLRHEVALNALQQLLVWKMDTVALAVAEAILEVVNCCVDITGNSVRVGDQVAYVSENLDSHLTVGTVTAVAPLHKKVTIHRTYTVSSDEVALIVVPKESSNDPT